MMAVTLLNPEGLPKPPADVYRHVAIATGTRHVHIAGQIEQAYRNIATALASTGATFSDVVRLTFYVVDWTPEKFPALLEGIARVTEELHVRPRAGVAHRGSRLNSEVLS